MLTSSLETLKSFIYTHFSFLKKKNKRDTNRINKKYRNRMNLSNIIPFLLYSFCFNGEVLADEKFLLEEWRNSWGGNSYDAYEKVAVSGNYIYAVGYSYSTDTGSYKGGVHDGIISKYTLDGQLVWTKNFGGASVDSVFNVFACKSGGIYVCGYSGSTDIGFLPYQGFLAKFNENGEQVWITKFGDDGVTTEIRECVELSNGNIVVVGLTDGSIYGTKNGTRNAMIIKYDSSGNKLWHNTMIGTGTDVFRAVVELSNGEIVVVGESNSTDISSLTNKGGYDGIIIKYDSNGKQMWLKSIGGQNDEYLRSITKDNDDNFYIVGHTNSPEITTVSRDNDNDGLILKYDINGNLIWQKVWGGSGLDQFFSVVNIDNNLIIAGRTSGNEGISINGSRDSLVIMYDKDGNNFFTDTWGGSGGELFLGITGVSDYVVAVGECYSTDLSGIPNNGVSEAVIVKYAIKDVVKPESKPVLNSLYLIPENILELSLNTNSIVFENFSVLEATEKLNAIEIKVSSSLAYDMSVSLETDVLGESSGTKLDSSIISLKLSTDSTYKTFSNDNKKLQLLDGQSQANTMFYNIDLKIKGNEITRFDVYKAMLKFEVVQI
jgi:hypothetical protein